MDTLINLTFKDADDAHRAHLATESYAQHEALGEFYASVREATDAFVEAAIALDLPPPATNTDLLTQLEESYVALVDGRDVACQSDAALENLHDEIAAVYLKAIYKLKRFTQP